MKHITKLCLVMICIMLLAGSAFAASETISFWTFGTETPELKAVMNQFRADFLRETDIEVDWKMIGWGDYHQNNLMVISSRKGPDVTQIGTTTVSQQAMAGVFDEVTPLFEELGGDDVFFAASVKSTMPDALEGHYAIPWFVDPRALIYRKDLLEKNGLELPTTWDDLVKVAKVLQENEGMEYPVGMAGSELAHEIYQAIAQAGGDITSQAGNKFYSAMTSDEAKAGVRFLTDLVILHEVASPATGEYDKATLRAKFAHGEIAFYYDSPQAFTYMEQNAPELLDKMGVGPAPAGPGGKRSCFLGGSNLAIYNFTKKREAAVAWIKYLIRPENVAIWAKAYGNVPGVIEATNLEGFDEEPWASFIDVAVNHGYHPPINPGGTLAQVEGLITNNILGANLSGTYTEDIFEKTMVEAERMHQRIIDQFK